MKIAFFIGSLNRGGTETLVLDTFRKRELAPFECILIYRNDGDLSEEYRATGVKMIRIKPSGIKLGYIYQLRRLLRQEEVEILHTQTLLNAFLGLFCVCFSRVKLIASFHGLFTTFLSRLLSHFVIWSADASIFVSEYVYKWYLKHVLFAPSKRCHVVYNGIDFSKFDLRYPDPDFLIRKRSRFGGCIRLAMVGSFVGGRSQLFVCKCLKRLRDKGIANFDFFFVGKRSMADPEKYDACVRFCNDNELLDKVHFLGGRSDVPAILQHIDGFVYATNSDTFGIAVVEAMAAGVPVIVNDWAVMKEITNNGQWATLYESNNINDCVSVLEKLIKEKLNWKNDARRIAGVVKEHFSIENHINALNQVYEKTLL